MGSANRAGGWIAAAVVSSLAMGCTPPQRPNWTYGLPFCGNGTRGSDEECDPPGPQAQCPVGLACTATCRCAAPCDCCASLPTRLEFTTHLGAGSCGQTAGAVSVVRDLACGGVFAGGGQNTMTLPWTMPDGVLIPFQVTACDPGNRTMTLAAIPAPASGVARECTAAGCLVGPPLPVPNSAPALSSCIVTAFGLAASGTASCDGTATLTLPLDHEVFLTGDAAPTVPGVQPCPVCVQGRCAGGANNGLACRAEGSLGGDAYPTSSDCPPLPAQRLGGFAATAEVVTGPVVAQAYPTGPSGRVFCGYCRNQSTSAFAHPVVACASDADCHPPFHSCEQRSNGAFGPGGGGVEHITITGTAGGCLAGGAAPAVTLAGGGCVAPSFSGPVNLLFDLPGPETLSLPGELRLQ